MLEPEARRRVRCPACGHLIWIVDRSCTCSSRIEHRCRSCGAMLLVTGARSIVITAAATR